MQLYFLEDMCLWDIWVGKKHSEVVGNDDQESRKKALTPKGWMKLGK